MVKRGRGFTLIELLVATSMLTLLAAAGFAALSAGTRSAAKVKRYGAMIAHGQTSLDMMARDIRAAVQNEKFCLVSLDNEHEGMYADTLDIVSLGAPRIVRSEFEEEEEPGSHSRCEVGYYIENDSDTEMKWLLRREDATLDNDPVEGGAVSLAGPFVSELNFEFYDGLFWQSGWDNRQTFPAAVRVTLVVVDEDEVENPMYFSTTVPIITRQ
jgi:type II secretion system protein J